MTKYILLPAILLAALFATLFLIVSAPSPSLGSATPGLPARVATSSNATVTSTQSRVAATTSACTSRIITTSAQPVMLTFSDQIIPTGSFGHIQSASTTVVYDSGQYGCDAIRAYSPASALITISITE